MVGVLSVRLMVWVIWWIMPYTFWRIVYYCRRVGPGCKIDCGRWIEVRLMGYWLVMFDEGFL